MVKKRVKEMSVWAEGRDGWEDEESVSRKKSLKMIYMLSFNGICGNKQLNMIEIYKYGLKSLALSKVELSLQSDEYI